MRDQLHLRPRGPARLRDELRGRGVATEIAQGAVDRRLAHAGVTDESLAVQVALRWLFGKGAQERPALASASFGSERETALRCLVGFLKRRGFGGEAVCEPRWPPSPPTRARAYHDARLRP